MKLDDSLNELQNRWHTFNPEQQALIHSLLTKIADKIEINNRGQTVVCAVYAGVTICGLVAAIACHYLGP